eukprot:NODE_1027_length_1312_cov_48.867775_g846_i0.p6 GENE.NODE_1027_length_1312_cov_48.867775_g846_i0~~NODE_1027_length_1312_cov_48.867775_g846_i0.p6  ORF type:complete len:85 (-),score=35.59 NODE_1027_length_1312_cov_48.867775_g846_i0:164-418(-)
MFLEEQGRQGTIAQVLEKLQKTHQRRFNALYAEEDDITKEMEKEIALTTSLLDGAVGRDKSGMVRPITTEDVREWVSENAEAML